MRRRGSRQDGTDNTRAVASAPSQAIAVKRALALQFEQAMNENRLTKAEMARRMGTSRSQLNRLLDPDSDSVTLDALSRAAEAVGRLVKVELVEAR
jgi:predicted XRE-type DNA-binding protein